MARYHGGEEIDRATHSTNFTEFCLKKQMDAKLLLIRIGLIALYAGLVIGGFCIPGFGMYLGVVIILAVIIAGYFTWPLTNIEYEYVTASGDITFTTIYGGGKKRKDNLKFKIKDCEIIAPYTSEYADKYASVANVYDFRSSVKQTSDVYFMVIGDKKVLFQCTNKALKIFKSYNKEKTVSVDTLVY